MKHIKTFFIILIGFFTLISCGEQQQTSTSEPKTEAGVSKIEVIDFHSTHRCFTCNAIENNTKFTLETYFKEELASGKITFQVLNVDDESNFALAEKFEATGTALFVNTISNGKEQALDLTQMAFAKGKDQDAFSADLKQTIEKQLKQL
jgi:hypothetical protein